MKKYTYKSASFLSKFLIVLLVMSGGLSAIAVFSSFLEYNLLISVRDGLDITEDQALANDARQGVIGILQVIIFLVTVIFFCMWVYRMNRNANSIENNSLETTPGWAVGYFFIPVLNLWKPYQALKETYDAFRGRPGSNLVLPLWWFAWIMANIIGQFAFRIIMDAETLDELIRVSVIAMGIDAFDVFLTGMAILVVITVSKACTDQFTEDEFQEAQLEWE